jgi:DinB superfamily
MNARVALSSARTKSRRKVKVKNKELLTVVAVNSWKQVVGRLDQMLTSISDEGLQIQVTPGRNRVFYLIGHLTVIHDRLFLMLRLGDRSYPEFDAIFLDKPDQHAIDDISPAELRKAWADVNGKLTTAFETLRPEEWLEKHTAVSEQDFEKDPSRNRLAVLISRTNHASFHTGQIRLTR